MVRVHVTGGTTASKVFVGPNCCTNGAEEETWTAALPRQFSKGNTCIFITKGPLVLTHGVKEGVQCMLVKFFVRKGAWSKTRDAERIFFLLQIVWRLHPGVYLLTGTHVKSTHVSNLN